MKHRFFLFIISALMPILMQAQLNIDNAQFTIENTAMVIAKGNVYSNADILGTGILSLNGTSLQTLDMNGNIIPHLEINNSDSVTLTSEVKIGTALTFTLGKIFLDSIDFNLSEPCTITGMGANKFIETNGSAEVIKEIPGAIANYEIPLGSGSIYRPAFITTTSGNGNAKIGIRLLDSKCVHKPISIEDYLAVNWAITKTGNTGTTTISGQYDPTDVTGDATNLRGYYFDGTDWSSQGETHSLNLVSTPMSSADGSLYAMNSYKILKAKMFLQGAYNAGTGMMNDGLRTPVNKIPLSDPYRISPYNTLFTHVANPIVEIADASVFTDQPDPDNNIVDWVFIEIRNEVFPSNLVLKTRSALLQKDGDIVDVDGISPVTINNVSGNNFTIAVRHRNHLGLSTDPSTFLIAMNENKSATPMVDFTTETDAHLYGPISAFTNVAGKNMLWGGNTNLNNNVKYSGPSNDKDYILNPLLGGNTTAVLNDYNVGDVDLNGILKYSGPGNDKDYILSPMLNGIFTLVNTEYLP